MINTNNKETSRLIMVSEFAQHTDDTNNDKLSNIPRGLRDHFSDQEIFSVQELVENYNLREISTLITTLADQKIDEYQKVEEKDPVVQQEMLLDRMLSNKIGQAIRGRI